MNLNDLQNISDQFTKTERMPVLFLGHGSPMNAIEENQFVRGFREISKKFLLLMQFCVSLHIGLPKEHL
jgi:4,5-DOPA dioxygenase extradiol